MLSPFEQLKQACHFPKEFSPPTTVFGNYSLDKQKRPCLDTTEPKEPDVSVFVCPRSLRQFTEPTLIYACTEMFKKSDGALATLLYQLRPFASDNRYADDFVRPAPLELQMDLKSTKDDRLCQTLLIDERHGRIFHLVLRLSTSYIGSTSVASIELSRYDATFDPSNCKLIEVKKTLKPASFIKHLGPTTAPKINERVNSIALSYLNPTTASTNNDLLLSVFYRRHTDIPGDDLRQYTIVRKREKRKGRHSGLKVVVELKPRAKDDWWFALANRTNCLSWLGDSLQASFRLCQAFNGLLATDNKGRPKIELLILPKEMHECEKGSHYVVDSKRLFHVRRSQPDLLTVTGVDLNELMAHRCFTCGEMEGKLSRCKKCKRLAIEMNANEAASEVVMHQLRFCSRRCLKITWAYHDQNYHHNHIIRYNMMEGDMNLGKRREGTN